jgi:uncharacterized membrane protein (DUF441 family)
MALQNARFHSHCVRVEVFEGCQFRAMVNFNWAVGMMMLCEKTHFRPCRLTGRIENHGCPGLQIGTWTVVYDLPFFLLSLIVAVFFLGFFIFLKDFEVKWKNQRPTRGVLYWRAHLIACGLAVFFYGVSVTFTSSDGPAQRAMLVLRGICQLSGALLLIWIAFVDMQLLPVNRWIHIAVFCVSIGISLCWIAMYNNPTPSGIITLGILFPIFSGFFHLFAMIPVCVKRKIWAAIGYCFLMCGFNIAAILVDMYGNAPICQGTTGILSGSSVAVLLYAFYRVFVQVFYAELKKAERDDGLPLKRRKIDDPSSDDVNKPFPVEFKDYSYSYTYSDSQKG